VRVAVCDGVFDGVCVELEVPAGVAVPV